MALASDFAGALKSGEFTGWADFIQRRLAEQRAKNAATPGERINPIARRDASIQALQGRMTPPVGPHIPEAIQAAAFGSMSPMGMPGGMPFGGIPGQGMATPQGTMPAIPQQTLEQLMRLMNRYGV